MLRMRILGIIAVVASLAFSQTVEAQVCTYCDGDIGGCWVREGNGWIHCTNTGAGSCLLEGPCSIQFASELSADGVRTGVSSVPTFLAKSSKPLSALALRSNFVLLPSSRKAEIVNDCAGFITAVKYDSGLANDRRLASRTIII